MEIPSPERDMPTLPGALAVWGSNELSLGIAPLNGIVVALVLAWVFEVRAARAK